MQLIRQKSFSGEGPILYLVPTPIGNLEDMTYRSVRILSEVDIIFAEDTRVSMKLLSHFDIHKPLKSFHEHNTMEMTEVILNHLQRSENVALISDAGMPLISDPGFEIVKRARESNYKVVALPGANALLTGLVASGIEAIPFTFIGFLDTKQNKRRFELEQLGYREETLVFYEAPHRLKDLLQDLLQVFGDRTITIARELSKTFEEIIHGTIRECLELEDLKGEMVVIVQGYQKEGLDHSKLSVIDQVDYFIASGLSKTDAMKKVAMMTGIPKNKIYHDYLENKLN